MRRPTRSRACRGLARVAALVGGLLLLAGCATGYSFVQPGIAGAGGYYSGEGPYSGQGYYDDYGTSPYADPYGYFGGDYGYGPQWTFNPGFSNAWNFPGYWEPWFTTVYPSWGCRSWRCGNRHHHPNDRGHDHHGRGTASWQRGDQHPSGAVDLTPARQRESEASAWRHDHYVRAPGRDNGGRYIAVPPPMPAGLRGGAPGDTSFAGRPAQSAAIPLAMPAPQEISGAPRASYRAARPFAPMRTAPPPGFRSVSPMTPMRSAPQPSFRAASPVTPMGAAPRAVPSSSRNDGTPGVKIR